jgi:hypothetical protein
MKVGSETDIPEISKLCRGRRLQCRPIVIHIADRAHRLQRAHDGSAALDRCGGQQLGARGEPGGDGNDARLHRQGHLHGI